MDTIKHVFEIKDRVWRGIGNIPYSGYEVKESYSDYDANIKFDVNIVAVEENKECIAGQVLKGIKKPHECPQFGKKCKPEFPLGAPMVSSEGACAAYYHFHRAADYLEATV
jgi:hydrogenase expression/formation protein HypD